MALAISLGTPINRLIDEMAALMLTEFDAETRIQIRAVCGTDKTGNGLALLEKAVL